MNQTTFQKSLRLLSEATNKQLSPELIRYWWQKYGDLPDEVLLTGFQVALDTCTFFPSPAEFNGLLRQISAAAGAVVDGASAWDAMERAMFSCWSETNDRVNVREYGYPWPNERCKAILRGDLNCTVRLIAEMHPAEYAKTRERFIQLFDRDQQVEQASTNAARLAEGSSLRMLKGGA